uniref:Putative capsid protein n=1 Tax=viral metagenome TaxID=1070528 RepID=A0A6H1ZVH8_9ZZZZ
MRNGRLGRIGNFTLYKSNNYTAVTDTYQCYHVLSGHPKGLTFASQMTKMESLRAESTFGSIVRGLSVYGYKVTIPTALVDLYCRKG